MIRDPDINLDKLKYIYPDSFGSAFIDNFGMIKGVRYIPQEKKWIEYWNAKAKKAWSRRINILNSKAQRFENSLLRELDDESIMSICHRS